jgi:hypothetical protein
VGTKLTFDITQSVLLSFKIIICTAVTAFPIFFVLLLNFYLLYFLILGEWLHQYAKFLIGDDFGVGNAKEFGGNVLFNGRREYIIALIESRFFFKEVMDIFLRKMLSWCNIFE